MRLPSTSSVQERLTGMVLRMLLLKHIKKLIFHLTYGRHALEQAIFYSSSDQLGLDVTVLGAFTLAALVLGTLSMRSGIAR